MSAPPAAPAPLAPSAPPAGPRPSARHVPALDGIRGLAILLVLAHELNVMGGELSRPAHAISLIMDLGWVGVQLFFVLSGFLITGILLDTRDAPNYYRSFLGRRVLRIFPLYYAVLTVAFVVAPLLGRPISGHEHQIWLWTYLSNWAEPFGRAVPLFTHFWSLSIEEQFYLAWPFLVRRLSPSALLRVCGALMVLALASRVALRAVGAGPDGAYMFTFCRADALAAGAATAVLLRTPAAAAVLARWPLRWLALALTVATVILTRGAPRSGVLTQTFGYTCFALGLAALVLAVALVGRGDWLTRALSTLPLRSAGKYSYAMYVFHTPLHLLVGVPLLLRLCGRRDVGLLPALGYFVAATCALWAAAALSYHLFERQFLRLKIQFVAAPKGAA